MKGWSPKVRVERGMEIPLIGLVTNMVSFNVGVEIGQLLALSVILLAFNAWRTTGGFIKHAYASNVALMCAGFVLIGYQLTGYAVS